jgi:hypothetical protein
MACDSLISCSIPYLYSFIDEGLYEEQMFLTRLISGELVELKRMMQELVHQIDAFILECRRWMAWALQRNNILVLNPHNRNLIDYRKRRQEHYIYATFISTYHDVVTKKVHSGI